MSNTSPPGDDHLVFEANLDLEEDLVAELENFLLHVRLKVTVEALQIVDNVLWRHLQYFPVFAEVASFLIELGDKSRLTSMLLEMNMGTMSGYVLGWDLAKKTFFVIVRMYHSGMLRDLTLSLLTTRPQASAAVSYKVGEAEISIAHDEIFGLLMAPRFSLPVEVKERLDPALQCR